MMLRALTPPSLLGHRRDHLSDARLRSVDGHHRRIFSAASSLLQNGFETVTESNSVASTLIATVLVVATCNPIQDRVQKMVDQGFRESPDPVRLLKRFQEESRRRLSPVDAARTVRRFLEEAANAVDARGGAAFMRYPAGYRQIHSTGSWNGEEQLSIEVNWPDHGLARVVLSGQCRGRDYGDVDRRPLEQTAAVVGQAIEDDEGCGASGQ